MKSESDHLRIQPGEGRLVRFWAATELEKYRKQLRRLSEKDIRSNSDTIIIKENRYRTIYKTRLSFFDSPVLVKSFHFSTVMRTLRGYIAPYASRELAHAGGAHERGIPIATPLFLVRRRRGLRPTTCLLGYRFLEGTSLYDYVSGRGTPHNDRHLQLLRSAGEFTALLHDKGIIHRDYHAGNLLILRDGSMALIDLYPLSFKAHLSEKNRIEGLANLVSSLIPIVGKAGIDELIEGYRVSSSKPLSASALEGVMRRQRELRIRHEKSRAKRCMRNSSQFYQLRSSHTRIAGRRDLPPGEISLLLRDFDTLCKSKPQNALKNSPESVILKVGRPGRSPLCIKWYRRRGMLDQIKERLRGGRVLRAWKAGNGLLVRGIPAAVPLAIVKGASGGYLLMEAVEGVELDRLLSRIMKTREKGGRRARRLLTDSVGRLMGLLHSKGIFHADMKACNIMIGGGDENPTIKLVDYDHVRFFGDIPLRFVVKNLVQLNNSIPRGISRSLRFRFLCAYVGAHPDAPGERELFRMVWEASQLRPIVYVTDKGNRMESWRR